MSNDNYPALQSAQSILSTAGTICYFAGAISVGGGMLIGLTGSKPQPEVFVWVVGGFAIALIFILLGNSLGLSAERLQLELDNAQRLDQIVVATERTAKELDRRLSVIEAHAARVANATETLAATVAKR
jgi:hypothetical protein